jgi:hypothetical protein
VQPGYRWTALVCGLGVSLWLSGTVHAARVRLVPRGQGFDMVLGRGAKRVRISQGNGTAQTVEGERVTYHEKHFFRRGQRMAFASIDHHPTQTIFTLGKKLGVSYDPKTRRGTLLDGRRLLSFHDLPSLLRAANARMSAAGRRMRR